MKSRISNRQSKRTAPPRYTGDEHYLFDVEEDLSELARVLAGMASTVATVQDEFLTDDLLTAIGRVRAMELRLDGYWKGAYDPPSK